MTAPPGSSGTYTAQLASTPMAIAKAKMIFFMFVLQRREGPVSRPANSLEILQHFLTDIKNAWAMTSEQ
jgi:hypothetical protein